MFATAAPTSTSPATRRLATDPAAPPDEECLIETRGEGGYAIAPGSPGGMPQDGAPVRPSQRPGAGTRPGHRHRGTRPPYPRRPVVRPQPPAGAPEAESGSPAPACRRATTTTSAAPTGTPSSNLTSGPTCIAAATSPTGAAPVRTRGLTPTTGHCTSKAGRTLFYIFSSNALPFERGKGYSEVCDLRAPQPRGRLLRGERVALAEQGYGERQGRPSRNGTAGEGPGVLLDRPAGRRPNHRPQTPAAPGTHLTDPGNARRVVKRHGQDMGYVHPWKMWLVWNRQRWAEDQTGEAVRRVKETQGSLFKWAEAKIKELAEQGGDEDDERKAKIKQLCSLLAHLLKWEDTRAITRCLESARSEPGMPVLPEDLDRDPFLLNVLNGTIDLRTGQLRPHRHDDLITKLAPVAYDPKATCPLWERCLDRVDGRQCRPGRLLAAGHRLRVDGRRVRAIHLVFPRQRGERKIDLPGDRAGDAGRLWDAGGIRPPHGEAFTGQHPTERARPVRQGQLRRHD